MRAVIPVALTIAGSDPSGGAGLQADLKTFHRHGVYGESVVTLLTVQNTRAVSAIEFVDPGFVVAQIDAVVGDIPPAAAKTGALGRADIIEAVAARAKEFRFPLVVDPVMVSKHGAPLIADDAVDALVRRLLPLATVVTPNMAEAARLSGIEVTD
ncbi:MAG: bifunctional hydroxymethylpyrimidine kinase/phosphomethylpyrimidine kinase, partial [Phycisphaerales bacterium]